eukprot:scaffold1741_cov102-Isochrysis_galbana.AAC.4
MARPPTFIIWRPSCLLTGATGGGGRRVGGWKGGRGVRGGVEELATGEPMLFPIPCLGPPVSRFFSGSMFGGTGEPILFPVLCLGPLASQFPFRFYVWGQR